jgi:hypothetical protein
MIRPVIENPSEAPAAIDPGPGPIDPDEIAGRVVGSLAAHGWAHLVRPISDAEYEALARRLGTIELRTDLRVDPEGAARQRRDLGADAIGRPVLYEPEGMDFHTDRPSIDILAWRCVEQDAEGGESRWLDLRDMGEAFRPEEVDALGRIEVGYAVPDGAKGLEVRYHPLAERGPDGPLVYWAPWRLRPPEDEALVQLLGRFVAYVRSKEASGPRALRLSRGECLFLENRRTLHGRASLPPDSRRHLVRLYIRRAPRP